MLNDSRVREFLVAMLVVWYLKKSVNMKCSQDIFFSSCFLLFSLFYFPFFFFSFLLGVGGRGGGSISLPMYW